MKGHFKQISAASLCLALMLPVFSGCSTVPEQAKPAASKGSKPATAVKKTPAKKAAAPETSPVKPPAELVSTPLTPKGRQNLSPEVLYYLLSAEVAGQRGQLELASAMYTRAALLARDAEVAQRAARIAVYARDEKNAVEASVLWVELEPENIEARQVLAALLVKAGREDESLAHFEKVLNAANQSEQQRFMLVTTLLSKESDKQTAMGVMSKLIAKRQDNPYALYAYANLAMLVENYAEAETAINKVIKLKPDWADAHILQSNIYNRQGLKNQSLSRIEKAVADQPDNDELHLFLARRLVDAKRYEEAIRHFSRVLELRPERHEARYALGLLSLQLNNLDDAEEYFTRLINYQQHLQESRYYLGQISEMRENYAEAIERYRRVDEGEYRFESQIRIAIITAKQGELDDARMQLQNISADSAERELRLYLVEGDLLRDRRKHEEAYNLYTDGLAQMPDNSRLLYARALTAEKLGRISLAINDLKKIVQQEPNNGQALNALGYTLVDQTDQLQEGLSYIQKAIKLIPDDPAVIDSLGWAYYRLGQHAKAIEHLRKAFDKLKDPEVAAHLGEVLWVSGDKDEARRVWDEALRKTPDDQILLNVIQRLTK